MSRIYVIITLLSFGVLCFYYTRNTIPREIEPFLKSKLRKETVRQHIRDYTYYCGNKKYLLASFRVRDILTTSRGAKVRDVVDKFVTFEYDDFEIQMFHKTQEYQNANFSISNIIAHSPLSYGVSSDSLTVWAKAPIPIKLHLDEQGKVTQIESVLSQIGTGYGGVLKFWKNKTDCEKINQLIENK